MPDHVHVIVWFPEDNPLGHFMKPWNQRSSVQIKRLLCPELKSYARFMGPRDPVWQPRYDDFNIDSEKKLREKLEYMHLNPVRAGLVNRPVDWPWNSARFYEPGRTVGVPVTWLLSSMGGDL